MSDNQPITPATIESRIFTIRGIQVMLDSHLDEMYVMETKLLNRAINRNKERFPEQFMFQITEIEFENIRSQIATSSEIRYQSCIV